MNIEAKYSRPAENRKEVALAILCKILRRLTRRPFFLNRVFRYEVILTKREYEKAQRLGTFTERDL